MKKLDRYSYQCGVIDAFNEVVRAGVKRIALSHPADSREEAMELSSFFAADLSAVRQTIFIWRKARC